MNTPNTPNTNEILTSFEINTFWIITMILFIWLCLNVYISIKLKRTKKQTPVPSQLLLEKNRLIDSELDLRLIKVFDMIMLKKYLFIFKQYGNLSDEHRMQSKKEFINEVEANLSPEEKVMLNTRFLGFDAFKVYLLHFFNNRMTKMELSVMLNIKDETFNDSYLYEAVLGADKADILKIMDEFSK